MKNKKTAKSARKTSKTSRSFVKGRILVAGIQTSDSNANACVPRIQLQSAMARYRTTLARLNAKRREVMRLQFKVRSLECRIREVERQLAQRSTAP